jgi:hypothetical protein
LFLLNFLSILIRILFLDAHRALELLESYCSQLNSPSDKQLKIAIERLINVFKSKLFQALLGKSHKSCESRSFNKKKKHLHFLRYTRVL